MKKLFTLFLALVASIGTMFAESGTCGDNLTWDLTDSVLTIFGTGAMTDFSYPDCGPWYAQHESITSVMINDGVTGIGDYAFYGCSNLTSINIPNSVTSIGESAFVYCWSLSAIEIPNSVIRIGDGAFGYCWSLSAIEIPNRVTSIGDYAFCYCYDLTSITIPNGVTSIGEGIFEGCSGLIFVIIGNSVTGIGDYAFYNCTSLTSVTIGNSVTNIGDGAFYSCTGLTSITCEAVTPPALGNNVFYYVNQSIPLYVPEESIDAYKAADQWKEFNPIQPISTQSIEDIQLDAPQSTKILLDGQIYILRGEHVYDTAGKQVR